ncbi:hypothetical protein D3C73_1114170 [compost metagenome]
MLASASAITRRAAGLGLKFTLMTSAETPPMEMPGLADRGPASVSPMVKASATSSKLIGIEL